MTLAVNGNSFGFIEPCRIPGVFTFATLPSIPTGTSTGKYCAWTSDQGLCWWGGTNWVVIGGGGGAGPGNTPGFGAAVITDNAPATTLTDYSPTGLSFSTSEIRIATTADTTLNSLVATGRTAGSSALLANVGVGNLFVNHQGAGTAAYKFRCMGQAQVTIPIEGCAIIVYDATSGAWRFA